jgi:hypothetical protein
MTARFNDGKAEPPPVIVSGNDLMIWVKDMLEDDNGEAFGVGNSLLIEPIDPR